MLENDEIGQGEKVEKGSILDRYRTLLGIKARPCGLRPPVEIMKWVGSGGHLMNSTALTKSRGPLFPLFQIQCSVYGKALGRE